MDTTFLKPLVLGFCLGFLISDDLSVYELVYEFFTVCHFFQSVCSSEVNNNDHLVTIQCYAEKLWVLTLMGCYFDMYHPPEHYCRPDTTCHAMAQVT